MKLLLKLTAIIMTRLGNVTNLSIMVDFVDLEALNLSKNTINQTKFSKTFVTRYYLP